jgi:arylsulfatase A-like enzyme
VVVVIDTLRADHLDAYGYARETAPFLRDLASRSVLFFDALSTSSWTAPATASLFTGLYPNRHQVNLGFFAHRRRVSRIERTGGASIPLNRLSEEVATLSELLRGLGYRTFGLAANVNIGSEIGFDRGFDRFERFAARPLGPEHRDDVLGEHPRVSAPAERVYTRLLDWEAEIRRSEPYFLYLHLNDPHQPYHKRRPWFREGLGAQATLESAYDSEISYTDAVLEKIYARLELSRNTLLLVLSDHGEAFGERGFYGHPRGLYRELNRILLLVSGPDLGIQPGVSRARVSIVDILPTLMARLGGEPPENRDGWSLSPLLDGGEARARLERALEGRVRFAHRAQILPRGLGESWAAMRQGWKLIHESGGWELYDTDADPGERRNVLREHPEIRARLEPDLVAFRAAAQAAAGTPVEVQIDAETLEALRALGYVNDP